MSGKSVDYSRSLSAPNLDQPTLDAEGYGEKKALKREADGLRITLAPGDAETGWKTPQQLRFGGDFTISANLVIKKLPKPAQEDGAAVGIAIAFQDINQPDVTFVRLREPNGAEVYRSIEKADGSRARKSSGPDADADANADANGPQQGMASLPSCRARRSPRRATWFGCSSSARAINIRFQVKDAGTGRSRYLGQVQLGQ